VACRVACPGAVHQGAYQEAYQAACLCTHTQSHTVTHTVTARQSCSRRGGKHNIHTQAPATSKWYRLQPLSSTTRAWTSAELRSYLGGPPGGIPGGMPGGIPLNESQSSKCGVWGGGCGWERGTTSESTAQGVRATITVREDVRGGEGPTWSKTAGRHDTRERVGGWVLNSRKALQTLSSYAPATRHKWGEDCPPPTHTTHPNTQSPHTPTLEAAAPHRVAPTFLRRHPYRGGPPGGIPGGRPLQHNHRGTHTAPGPGPPSPPATQPQQQQ
jgi:hypothetical protein